MGRTGQLTRTASGGLPWVSICVPERPGQELLPGAFWRRLPQPPGGWHVAQELAATCAPNLSALFTGLEPAFPTLIWSAPPGLGFPIAPSLQLPAVVYKPAAQSRKPTLSPIPDPFLDWARKLVGGLGEN